MDPIIGAKSLVTAKNTKDDATALTYEAVEEVEGLVEISLEDNSGDSEPQYADDVEKYRLKKAPKLKLTIELLAAAHATLAKFFGHTTAAGVTTKKGADTPPYRAFGFMAEDGGGKFDGIWLKKCVPTKRTNSMTYHTQEGDKTAVQTVKVEFECIPTIYDGEYVKMCNSGDEAMAAAWATWFDSVPSAMVMYTVTYAAGGGTGDAPVQAPLYAGQMFITAVNPFANAEKTFLGWSDGTNTYDEGHAVVVGTANITLTATWSE